jgi:hypothetical protein
MARLINRTLRFNATFRTLRKNRRRQPMRAWAVQPTIAQPAKDDASPMMQDAGKDELIKRGLLPTPERARGEQQDIILRLFIYTMLAAACCWVFWELDLFRYGDCARKDAPPSAACKLHDMMFEKHGLLSIAYFATVWICMLIFVYALFGLVKSLAMLLKIELPDIDKWLQDMLGKVKGEQKPEAAAQVAANTAGHKLLGTTAWLTTVTVAAAAAVHANPKQPSFDSVQTTPPPSCPAGQAHCQLPPALPAPAEHELVVASSGVVRSRLRCLGDAQLAVAAGDLLVEFSRETDNGNLAVAQQRQLALRAAEIKSLEDDLASARQRQDQLKKLQDVVRNVGSISKPEIAMQDLNWGAGAMESESLIESRVRQIASLKNALENDRLWLSNQQRPPVMNKLLAPADGTIISCEGTGSLDNPMRIKLRELPPAKLAAG